MSQERKEPSAPAIQEDAALDSLEDRLAAARVAEEARLDKERGPIRDSGVNSGWAMASTMVGYPLGGIVIGFLIDNLLNTTPWITIVLMFTAFVGACLHVVRNNDLSAK